MPTKAELEKRIEQLQGELDRCRRDRDLLASKFITVEQILFTLPSEIPVRNDGTPRNYIESRQHLINEIKAALI